MTFPSAKRALAMFETMLHGLSVIQGLTKVGGDQTKAALAAIGTLVEKLKHGFDDPAIDPKAILAEIDALRDQISANNADADAKLAAKFDVSEEDTDLLPL